MAFSKARRLSDLVSSTGEISSFVDGSVTHADLHSNMDLTGKTVLVTTQSASDNDTSAASTAYVTTAISNLIDSAPGTMDTLNEIAAALNDDANFNTTVTNAIAAKLPLAGGTLTGGLTINHANGLFVHDTNGTSSNRLKFLYNGTSGVATLGPDSASGNTSLAIGTSSATAGFTTALTLDSSQNASFAGNLITNSRVAIGQASVTGGNVLLDLHGSGNGVGAQSAYYNDHNTSGFFVGLAGNTTGNPIIYNVPNTNIEFYTNNAIAMTITSSGTTFSSSVSTPAGFINGANGGIRIHSSGTKFFNITAANAARDNIMDIGAADARFKDLHLAGTISSGAITSSGLFTNTFGNGNVSAPSTSNHAAGTRQVYYDGSATAWYARGIEGSTLWDNVDQDYKLYRQASLRLQWSESSSAFLPGADNSYDLGSTSKRWRNVYTTDLQLSNENTGGNDVDGTEGNWTLQEGETDLYIINNKSGKKYKFALEEIE